MIRAGMRAFRPGVWPRRSALLCCADPRSRVVPMTVKTRGCQLRMTCEPRPQPSHFAGCTWPVRRCFNTTSHICRYNLHDHLISFSTVYSYTNVMYMRILHNKSCKKHFTHQWKRGPTIFRTLLLTGTKFGIFNNNKIFDFFDRYNLLVKYKQKLRSKIGNFTRCDY